MRPTAKHGLLAALAVMLPLLGSAAARAEDLLAKVKANGAAWKADLEKLAAEFPKQIKAVTGRGYMLGIDLHGEPAPYLALLRDEGLLCPSAGTHTIRLLPPLIATREDLDRATAMIRAVLVRKDY